MKHSAKLPFLAFLVATQFLLNSCSKKETEPEPQLTQQLASPTVVAQLRALGMTIIESGKPVQVEGIYEMKPSQLSATNIPGDSKVGEVFADPYRFQFSNQSESQQTITLKDKVGTQSGQSTEGFVAGSGNKFSVIVTINSSFKTSTSKALVVISGELTGSGIKDVQQAFYILEKNDPDNLLVAVGSIRVHKDQDGLAAKVSALRLPADGEPVNHDESGGLKARKKQ